MYLRGLIVVQQASRDSGRQVSQHLPRLMESDYNWHTYIGPDKGLIKCSNK